ncbi:Altered inheritance of mitochondria protein 6-like protein [Fusarium oxysporum f. sp. raphani]|uniref:Altered inheritance of mitochondria protein 6-like protein n=1 Tax=Fusarium oxysporum f. sp. raphani TaxID=96318 RepID=A0A8J5UQ50_FUSOX|nr:Altered inheritance of mitochondria protein 6-like protein [Fusarium oxysporum f. sp. raphani]
MVSKNGVPRLGVRTNPYIFAFGMTVAAISSIALMFAAILATTSMIWPYTPEVQAGSLHIRSYSVPDDTVPIPCHSHNDYWKAEPLTSAITTGCIGIEVDVWKVRDELMVGHAEDELSTEKTLTSITTSSKGWLSHVSDGEFVSRPITVVATGETKFRLVKEANPSHDVFFDAPLKSLSRGQYDNTNSYYASTSFKKSIGKVPKKGLRPTQLELIRDQISQAHIRGLMVRYWGMPLLPQNVRRQVEKVLLDEGVDVINVDDLQGAKRTFAERRHSND